MRTREETFMAAHVLVFYPHPKGEALQAGAGSSGGREALEHAASISSGGAPAVVMAVND
jgi:hypothetical protein